MEALNFIQKALKDDEKNRKVKPKALKGNERRQICHSDVKWRWKGVEKP